MKPSEQVSKDVLGLISTPRASTCKKPLNPEQE